MCHPSRMIPASKNAALDQLFEWKSLLTRDEPQRGLCCIKRDHLESQVTSGQVNPCKRPLQMTPKYLTKVFLETVLFEVTRFEVWLKQDCFKPQTRLSQDASSNSIAPGKSYQRISLNRAATRHQQTSKDRPGKVRRAAIDPQGEQGGTQCGSGRWKKVGV